jgi:hypothetical protein
MLAVFVSAYCVIEAFPATASAAMALARDNKFSRAPSFTMLNLKITIFHSYALLPCHIPLQRG